MNLHAAVLEMYSRNKKVRYSEWSPDTFSFAPDNGLDAPVIQEGLEQQAFIPDKDMYLKDSWILISGEPADYQDNPHSIYRAMMYMYALGKPIHRRAWSSQTHLILHDALDTVPCIRFMETGVMEESRYIPTKQDLLFCDWDPFVEPAGSEEKN